MDKEIGRNTLMYLGNRLRQQRLCLNLTQEDLAEALGVSVQSISRWERHETIPQAHYRLRLSRFFGSRSDPLEAQAQETTDKIFFLPYQRNPYFTGRRILLESLHRLFAECSQVIALYGLAGIGKTQTALEYAYLHRQDYSAIFWLNADTQEHLLSSLVSLASLLNLGEQNNQHQSMKAVLRWLQTHQNWLLIVDNIEDPNLLTELLSAGRSGTFLLTTCLHTLGPLAHMVELGAMPLEEGRSFLLTRAGGRSSTSFPLNQQEHRAAQWIVEAMEGLPLALEQAGAYIEENRCSLSDFFQMYQHHTVSLLDTNPIYANHPLSVAKTFALAFEKVSRSNIAATEILTTCAFLAPDAIPEELFLLHPTLLGPMLAEVVSDPLAWNVTLKELLAYSLIRRDPQTQMLSIHRLVQTVLQSQLDPEMARRRTMLVIEMVNRCFPNVEELTTWQQCQRLLPQVLICATMIEREGIVTEAAGRLLHQASTYMLEHAGYQQAGGYIRLALAIRRSLFGEVHLEVAESLNHLAELAYYQGDYQEAERLHTQALTIRQALLGEQHLEIAASWNNLAGVYLMQGRYQEAEPLYQRVLRLREQIFGPDHLDVAESAQNLAYLYMQQERYAQAEPLYQRCFAICQEQLEIDHAYLTTILNNLGKLFVRQSHLQEAEVLLLRAMVICKNRFTADHPRLALTYSNLAELASAQGDDPQAERFYLQAISILERSLGVDHPRTAQNYHDLALIYLRQRQPEQAKQLLARALKVREKTLGPDQPETRATREHYAQIQL